MPYKIKKQYRLKGWDYANNGYYFVTICTSNRKLFFGNVDQGKMALSLIGEIVKRYWLEIPNHFANVSLDEWIIMPNHLHGIIVIERGFVGTGHCPVLVLSHQSRRTGQCPVPTTTDVVSKFGKVKPQSLSTIVGSFKSICSKIINRQFPDINFTWQTRFYDRVLRNEKELIGAREYIYANPAKWEYDRNNLEGLYM